MPSQILNFPHKKSYFYKGYSKNCYENQERQLASQGGQLERGRNILKMKIFYMTKCRAYLHEKLNTSKGVIRSRGLALATEEEIASALGK